MIIVGELINASRKPIGKAIDRQDADAIKKVAREQFEAGANYIDVNAGVFVGKEPKYLKWLVEQVQQVVEAPCAVDSPDPDAIEAALAVHKGTPMINSISLEKGRYEKLLPIVSGTGYKVIALCTSDEGVPETAEQRMKNAEKLINGLVRNGVALENIYVDPLVQPISTNVKFGIEFLDTIEEIKKAFEGVHTICGLSNISYGLPARKFMNRVFMSMAIAKGLDGAILNPLDKEMMTTILTAEALAGRDDFCLRYIEGYRKGKFTF